MGKVSKRELLRKIVFYISLIVFIVCAVKLFIICKGYYDNKKSYDVVREYGPQETQDNDLLGNDKNEPKFVFKKEDYNKLLSINGDFKGWINIPGTEVSYPLVQTDNNDYYLKHNFEKEDNSGGAIFISSNNEKPFEDRNTVIHGHHMRDGSMFASLMNFKEEPFAESASIYINTKDKLLQYKVFSVFYETANNDSYQNGFSTEAEYLSYVNTLKGKSMFNLNVEDFKATDKMITLSTCDYDVDDGRLLVCAKLVSSEDY